jgi:4-amino-4-deoxychorismate lyase
MNEILGSWVDGIPGAVVPVDDRGLQYGDGLFETMLIRSGRVRFLEAHLARLAQGCLRLEIPFAVDATLRAEIQTAASGRELAVLKLLVTRGSGPRGYAPRAPQVARRVMTLSATAPLTALNEGVSLRVAQLTLAANPALAGIKHLNRLENVLAAREAQHADCFDALLLDAAGLLVGGTMCNVFLVSGGAVVTPPVDRAGVAGVIRAIVLRECATLGLRAEIRPVAAAELATADEIFVTNARIGVVHARSVGEHVLPMNAIATRLAAHIETLDA